MTVEGKDYLTCINADKVLHVVCRAEKGSVISWVAVATDTSTFVFPSCVGSCQQPILQLNKILKILMMLSIKIVMIRLHVNVDEKIYVWKLSQKKQNHLPSVIS